jgi:hypothetical protein
MQNGSSPKKRLFADFENGLVVLGHQVPLEPLQSRRVTVGLGALPVDDVTQVTLVAFLITRTTSKRKNVSPKYI